jgi:RNA polymerase sigma factor (sigma-70 family)
MKETAVGPTAGDTLAPVSGSADPLQLYLRDLGPASRLTAEEEIALARQIRQGNDAAREKLITANLRLVVSIARTYTHYSGGLALDDLIEAGNIGLIRAVKGYDESKGYRFSTYAAEWIRRAIGHALLHDGRTIRIPRRVVEDARAFRQAWERLAQSLGAEPTFAEIAEELQADRAEVERLALAYREIVSIDAPVGDEHETAIVDTIPGEPAPITGTVSPEIEELRRDLATLPERQRRVLEARFGLLDGTQRTFPEIGELFGVSPSLARQLEVNGLDQLRRLRKRREGADRQDSGR